MTAKPVDLTICTVSFQSRYYLELSHELTQQLNDAEGLSWEWIAVENTPSQEADRLTPNDPRFTVLPGVDISNISCEYPAGYQHACGLNKALAAVKSRYVLILDPDFFIIRKNWIKETLDYMQRHKVCFLGTPYHPKWYMKIRYVPVAYCLFIDLKHVDRKDLDFIVHYPKDQRSSAETKKSNFIPATVRKFLSPSAQFLRWLILNRKLIEKERDTGWHLYDKIRRVGWEEYYKYECFVPVFRPRYDFAGRDDLSCTANRLLEKFLPDQFCYTPKRPYYFSEVGFKEAGYPDLAAREWEEYLWQDEPFGFHLRGYPKRGRDMRPEKEFLKKFLGRVTGLQQVKDH